MNFLFIMFLHLSIACLGLAMITGFTILLAYILEVICYGCKTDKSNTRKR